MTESYRDDAGLWHHSFRQSWLSTADRCPELARRTHFDLIDKRETDAACVGTAVHAGIEQTLEHQWDLDMGLEVVQREFQALTELDNFFWVKYTPTQARAFAARCYTLWYEEVLPTLGKTNWTEYEFDIELGGGTERMIRLTGTIDYLESSGRNLHIIDWKTAGRPYQPWEKHRWDIQSTVYTYAMHELGWGTPVFEFVVLADKGLQRIPVVRGTDHWAWLEHKCLSYAMLIEADLPIWPLSDSSALCSPKFCEAWSTCKGAYLGDEPW